MDISTNPALKNRSRNYQVGENLIGRALSVGLDRGTQTQVNSEIFVQ